MIKQKLSSFMITVPLFNGQKYPVPSRPLSRGPAVVPVIIGGLGAVTYKLKNYLALIPGCPSITMCQKITLLGSKQILKDVLSRTR